ncbi:hypothetical protein BASA82_000433 [Batrachochytrium salamandrivorans]|nr:hypothetical protein BASA82_000433 [Batrachochytrium salamandrivorans]
MPRQLKNRHYLKDHKKRMHTGRVAKPAIPVGTAAAAAKISGNGEMCRCKKKCGTRCGRSSCTEISGHVGWPLAAQSRRLGAPHDVERPVAVSVPQPLAGFAPEQPVSQDHRSLRSHPGARVLHDPELLARAPLAREASARGAELVHQHHLVARSREQLPHAHALGGFQELHLGPSAPIAPCLGRGNGERFATKRAQLPFHHGLPLHERSCHPGPRASVLLLAGLVPLLGVPEPVARARPGGDEVRLARIDTNHAFGGSCGRDIQLGPLRAGFGSNALEVFGQREELSFPRQPLLLLRRPSRSTAASTRSRLSAWCGRTRTCCSPGVQNISAPDGTRWNSRSSCLRVSVAGLHRLPLVSWCSLSSQSTFMMLTTRCSVTKGSLTPFSKQESRYSFKNCNAWTVMRWDAWTTSRMVRCDAGSRTTQALFDGAMFIGRLRFIMCGRTIVNFYFYL